MAFQSGKLIRIAVKEESTAGEDPGDTGATTLAISPGAGLQLSRTSILPNSVRSTGLGLMPRLGSRTVQGSYTLDMTPDGLIIPLEGAMRNGWAAPLVLDETDFTSITTGTDTIVFASGSPITLGLRVGDVIRLTNHATTANNNKNLRIKDLSATTITLHIPKDNGVAVNPLTADAVADTAVEITRLAKLTNNATAPVEFSYSIEEYFQGIDQTLLFNGCKFTGFTINGAPDGMATIEFSTLGMKQQVLATGASPYFTSPTTPTGDGFVFSDARISVNGEDVAYLTAFSLSYQVNAATQAVVGSDITPAVFTNDANLSGSVSLLMENLDVFTQFDAETEVELHLLLRLPGSEPQDCLSIFVPRLKYQTPDKPIGGDGALILTAPWGSGEIRDVSGYDTTLLTICTSATLP